jgi:hypothetical protein
VRTQWISIPHKILTEIATWEFQATTWSGSVASPTSGEQSVTNLRTTQHKFDTTRREGWGDAKEEGVTEGGGGDDAGPNERRIVGPEITQTSNWVASGQSRAWQPTPKQSLAEGGSSRPPAEARAVKTGANRRGSGGNLTRFSQNHYFSPDGGDGLGAFAWRRTGGEVTLFIGTWTWHPPARRIQLVARDPWDIPTTSTRLLWEDDTWHSEPTVSLMWSANADASLAIGWAPLGGELCGSRRGATCRRRGLVRPGASCVMRGHWADGQNSAQAVFASSLFFPFVVLFLIPFLNSNY